MDGSRQRSSILEGDKTTRRQRYECQGAVRAGSLPQRRGLGSSAKLNHKRSRTRQGSRSTSYQVPYLREVAAPMVPRTEPRICNQELMSITMVVAIPAGMIQRCSYPGEPAEEVHPTMAGKATNPDHERFQRGKRQAERKHYQCALLPVVCPICKGTALYRCRPDLLDYIVPIYTGLRKWGAHRD